MLGRLIAFVVGLFLIGVTVIVVILLYLASWNKTPVGSGAFKVYGASDQQLVTINYASDDTGGQLISEPHAKLPWTRTLSVSTGGLEAQITVISLDNGPVTCEIWVGETMVASHSDNASARCTYTPPR